ncbi:hypothetical protein BKA69DRAFT_475078 [Paraphysoderma sedebokerense]|nr:hypothetical protein BKA69DRAFT_208050 [Paraphysoderma sedebokerense]KAI9141072.1 hypothetical protein BKA69DRAFT_475078 [Paraphysoderma sedebokerense]
MFVLSNLSHVLLIATCTTPTRYGCPFFNKICMTFAPSATKTESGNKEINVYLQGSRRFTYNYPELFSSCYKNQVTAVPVEVITELKETVERDALRGHLFCPNSCRFSGKKLDLVVKHDNIWYCISRCGRGYHSNTWRILL